MITSTFTSELGAFTLTIDDSGTASTGFATKIGTIKYDFDIVGDENTVTSKIVAYNTFDFEMRDLDAVGNSLYDRLYTALASSTATVSLSVSVYANEESWQFAFVLNQSGLELNENTNILKCNCTTSFNSALTVSDAFSNVTNFVVKTAGADVNGISVGSFIEYAISQLNTSLASTFLNFAPCSTTDFVDEFYKKYDVLLADLNPGDKALFLQNDALWLSTNIFTLLSNLSILEGGIFGTGFDKNFYVNRISQGTAIEIDENYVLKRSSKPRNPAFSQVSILNNVAGNLVISSQTFDANPASSKTFVFGVLTPNLYKGEYVIDGGINKMWNNYTGVGSIDVEGDLLNSGLDNLKLSYPVSTAKIVNAEIRDCAKLKVYDSFYFADKPLEVFRISYAEYDFISNFVKIIAYQI